jgi:glutathione S-transferase
MPAIKFTYFDLRARGEPSRLLLAYSGLSYEDERIPAPWDGPETWAALKKTLAFGQLPKLEWDGEVLYTSLSIARFLAREFGLMGKNNLESVKVDEIVDVIQDTLNAGYTAAFMSDEKAKAEALAKHTGETIPRIMEQIEKRLESRGGQFMVGNNLTWADIQLFFFCNENSPCMAKIPLVANLVKRVEELPNIKKWVENRPKTVF